MGFVRLTCDTCKGKGSYLVQVNSLVPNAPMTCGNCNGEGSLVIHANAIGSSYSITMDPAAPSSDEVWATIWRRHDDGSLELIESGKVPPLTE